MLNRSVKRLALFIIIIYIFLIKSGYTSADLFAERKVSQNKLSAVTVNLSALSTYSQETKLNLFNSPAFQPGGFDLGAIKIEGKTSGKFKYYIRTVKTGGDDLLCSKLKISVYNRNFDKKSAGNLLALNINSNISTNKSDDWIFMISLDDNDRELKNKTCEFNLDIKSYYDNPDNAGGIYAQKIISNKISSGDW